MLFSEVDVKLVFKDVPFSTKAAYLINTKNMPIREACHVAVQSIHPNKQRLWKHAQARKQDKGKVSSAVPEGKGVSSSASVEVAIMSAIAAAHGLDISPKQIALLCQKAFKALLTSAMSAEQLTSLGELMYQCHYSYSACGLGSDGTDRLVQLVQESKHSKMSESADGTLFGAKITGGGYGGIVCVIGRNCLRSNEHILEKTCDGAVVHNRRMLSYEVKVNVIKVLPGMHNELLWQGTQGGEDTIGGTEGGYLVWPRHLVEEVEGEIYN